jgi:hypothetical protein
MEGQYKHGCEDNNVEVCGLSSSGSQHGPAACFCEHGNEPSISMNGEVIS